MRSSTFVTSLVVFVAVIAARFAASQEKGDEAAVKALALVQERLKTAKSPDAHVEVVHDSAVLKVFPSQRFVVVRYRLWPVAIAPPEGLKAQNLYVVKDGKLQHLTDAKGLEGVFKADVGKGNNLEHVARSWLRLSQEFIQDGYYKFALDEKMSMIAGSNITVVSGKATVGPETGNKGTLHASLTFDRDGKLTAVVEKNEIQPGMRPRCQATLLLHPDPFLRGVAELQLRVMGRWAKEYLDERRAAAEPQLCFAIDRLWQRIIEEGR